MNTKIRKDYEEGLSLGGLSRKYNLELKEVREIVEDIPIFGLHRSVPVLLGDVAKGAIELHNKGLSTLDIAEDMYLVKQSLYRLFKEEKIKPNKADIELILNYFDNNNLAAYRVSQLVAYSASTVKNILIKNGRSPKEKGRVKNIRNKKREKPINPFFLRRGTISNAPMYFG